MKAKKGFPKIKKEKKQLQSLSNAGVKKAKKQKAKKINSNIVICGPLKKDCVLKKKCMKNEKDTGKKIVLKQQIWNEYLKVFLQTERLNKKQKQIMEFCTNKSLTPPRRKLKFLKFIRNCFENQKDITDEQCNELFDLILKKYDEYKLGKYNKPKMDSSSHTKDTNSNKNKTDSTESNKKLMEMIYGEPYHKLKHPKEIKKIERTLKQAKIMKIREKRKLKKKASTVPVNTSDIKSENVE